jgi:hypothetical protein
MQRIAITLPQEERYSKVCILGLFPSQSEGKNKII